MDEQALERARERIRAIRPTAADTDAALERARAQAESLAEAASALEASLPDNVANAVREGVRAEAAPVARHLAEVRGLTAQVIRRLERMEGDLLAERHARVDDLALLVDLIASGWNAVDRRIAELKQALDQTPAAPVYTLERRTASG